jgi:hypothetical protein
VKETRWHQAGHRAERLTVSKRSSTAITNAPAPPARLGTPEVPLLAGRRLTRRLWVVWLAVAVAVAGVGWAAWVSYGPAPDGKAVCERFAQLKNAGDPAAEDLLGPVLAVPQGTISPEEAEPINADALLRGPGLRVLKVRPDPSARDGGRFLLATQGGAAGPTMRVRSGETVDRVQKVVSNPEIVVEVRDGKLYGLRVQLPRS